MRVVPAVIRRLREGRFVVVRATNPSHGNHSMALRSPSRPTISCIYAAFDPECRRIFRAAMAHSSGGVVRVADLVAAIRCERSDLFEGRYVSFALSPTAEAVSEVRSAPLSNEPALRELLERAYVAARMPSGPTTISPHHLLDAAVVAAAAPVAPFASPIAAALAPPPVARTAAEVFDTDAAIASVLNRWVKAHDEADASIRAVAISGLADDIRRIEAASLN